MAFPTTTTAYEGRYAEADANKALEELRTEGVACLRLSIGASTASDALERVFGSAGYDRAATLAELGPRTDEVFLASLRELAAPNPARGNAWERDLHGIELPPGIALADMKH